MDKFNMMIKVPAKIHDALMAMSDFARERFIIDVLEERMKDFNTLAEKLTESPE
jgi:NAD/NADP transhydrogenase alpha subunit